MLVDSGTNWLGEVPAHWKLSKIGHCFKHRNQTVSDQDFKPLSVTKNGVVPQLDTAAKSDNSEGRKLIRKGDFVINQRSDRKGSAGVSPLDGSCSVIYTVLEPLQFEPRYAHHLFRSVAFQEEFYRWGTGIVDDLWSTRYSLMKQIVCPVPPIEEQTAIANFLDRELAVLDALINAQSDLLETLLIRRKSLINELVSNSSGLVKHGDANKWKAKRLGMAVKKIEVKGSSTYAISLDNIGAHSGELLNEPEYVDQQVGITFRKGDVLFGKLRPYLGKAVVAEAAGVAVGDIHVYRSSELIPEFLKYWLLAPSTLDQINAATYGTKMPRANWEQIKNLIIQIPDLESQKQIVSVLEKYMAKDKKLIHAVNRSSQLLSERKAAIISAAATGKIDVRGKT